MKINDLSEIAGNLSNLANENLSLLNGKCQEPDEMQDYYLGILRRQAVLLRDLSIILQDRNSEYISTPFIILRGLMDDFIHLLYLENHENRESEITKINAVTYRYSFKSLSDLTNSNYEHFDGEFSFYLTKEKLEEVKSTFAKKEKNHKYFKNIENFKFKGFMQFSKMAKSFSISDNVDIYRDRAFYFWKEFSSFVHYSNYAFEYEIRDAEQNLNIINEAFQYCYNSIYLSFKYFEREYDLEFLDNEELNQRYGIIYKC